MQVEYHLNAGKIVMSSTILDLSAEGSSVSLTELAYQKLRAYLLQGTLPAGTLIAERRLAEQMGLSRTPVRDALSRLEGERFLSRNGRMLFVATVSVKEIIDILSIRRLLESDAARLAARNMPLAKVAELRQEIEAMIASGHVSDEEHWSADDHLHTGLADTSGNHELSRIIDLLRKRTRMFGMTRIPSRFDAGIREHLAILDAVAARDGDRAAELMRVHLDGARDAIIEALQGGTV